MDSGKSLDEKIKIDNNLSNRYIDLDPNGYFIIKVDFEEYKIILEHFSNNIDEEGYALDPETNEPIKCDSQNKRVSNEVFKGISAKQLGILITEERNDLITRFDHALYCLLYTSDAADDGIRVVLGLNIEHDRIWLSSHFFLQ